MNTKALKTLGTGTLRVIKVWINDDGHGLAAAISFYAIFSLAPILAAAMYFSAKFVGETKAKDTVVTWLSQFLSSDQAETIITTVAKSNFENSHGISILVAFGIFLWASSLVFVRLQLGVNRLLGFEDQCVSTALKNGILGRLKAMAVSLIIVIAIILGIIGVVTFGTSFLSGYTSFLNLLIQSLGMMILIGSLSTLLIRLLSSHKLKWKSLAVAVGCIVVLFECGRYTLTWYFNTSEVASAYGAASTLVVVLLWVYYNAQVFLLGVTIGGVVENSLTTNLKKS